MSTENHKLYLKILETAFQAVYEIEADICDRHGLRSEWNLVDDDMMSVIRVGMGEHHFSSLCKDV